MSTKECSWSVLKYDLKIALDILKLPNLVKLAEDYPGGIQAGSRIKFEKEIVVHFVRARVLELKDPDWFVFTKGEEFTKNHRRFVGTEILIPLEYGGKIRLSERGGGKEYFTIREVIIDFPRFVRVEKDTVCASPGILVFQIVRRGTVLELDRLTKSSTAIRGLRESYLICIDREGSRELAFKVMTPVHFKKLPDKTKYNLQYFVEHLPLPQTVEFVNINPYDIVSSEDEDANDLLAMLSGPVELLDLEVVNIFVGLIQSPDSERCECIVLPTECDFIKTAGVFIPSVCIAGNGRGIADSIIPGDIDCDIVHRKLYLQHAHKLKPVLLTCTPSTNTEYRIDEPPDTPPIPSRHDHSLLKWTLSAQQVAADEEAELPTCRRKCVSTGNMEDSRSISSLQSAEIESRGIKKYISRLTQRVKSSATHILFGIDTSQQSEVFMKASLNGCATYKDAVPERQNSDKRPRHNNTSGFVCYINIADDDSTDSPGIRTDTSKRDVCSFQTDVKDTHREAVYAVVDRYKRIAVTENVAFPCPICRTICQEIGL